MKKRHTIASPGSLIFIRYNPGETVVTSFVLTRAAPVMVLKAPSTVIGLSAVPLTLFSISTAWIGRSEGTSRIVSPGCTFFTAAEKVRSGASAVPAAALSPRLKST